MLLTKMLGAVPEVTLPAWTVLTKQTYSGSYYVGSVTSDSSSNVYTVRGEPNNTSVIVQKVGANGAVIYQKAYGYSDTIYASESAITCDSSDNVYFMTVGSDGDDKVYLTKLSSTGERQWTVKIYIATYDLVCLGCDTDSSGNVYALVSTAGIQYLLKFNSSGTSQWQRRWSGIGGTKNLLKIDASNNVYFVSNYMNSPVVIKYDVNGNYVQNTLLSISGSGGFSARSIDTDASGNIYVAGNVSISGVYNGAVFKLNSSMTYQWAKSIGTSDIFNSFVSVADGNVMVATELAAADGSGVAINKLSSSGSVSMTRIFKTTSGSTTSANGVSAMPDGQFVLIANISDSTGGVVNTVSALPTNGNGTGTFDRFTYASGSVTTASLTVTPSSMVDIGAVATVSLSSHSPSTYIVRDFYAIS